MTASELRRGIRPTAWAMVVIAVIVAMTASSAFAQTYPARTVTIITPFAAGSQTDAAARLVGLYLQDALGGSFIVENKAGAGGLIAANTVARAKPDGYTLLLTTNSTHSAIALFKSVPYDPIKDFSPIARIGNFPSFLAVNIDLPVSVDGRAGRPRQSQPGQALVRRGQQHRADRGGDVQEAHRRRHRAGVLPQQPARRRRSHRRPYPDDGAGHAQRLAAGRRHRRSARSRY